MGVNNYGGAGDQLSAPALSDWAASIAAALNGNDTPVDSRFLKLSGGQITGNLDVAGATTFKSSKAAVAVAGNWVNYAAPLAVSRSGEIATIEGFLRWNGTTTAITAGQLLNVGTVPVGFRPVEDVGFAAMFCLTASSGGMVAARGLITAAGGQVQFYVPASQAGSMANAGGWLILNASYRAV